MRTNALFPVALLLVSGCASGHSTDTAASPSPGATPARLASCEERRVTLDGADVFIQANVDATPAQIVILSAPNADVRARAYDDARKTFGDPHPDTRTQIRQYKLGLVQTTDLCGRPVTTSSATPSPTP